jgi:hypothetical protein
MVLRGVEMGNLMTASARPQTNSAALSDVLYVTEVTCVTARGGELVELRR